MIKMPVNKRRTIAYRRKRQGKTNYNKRLKLVMSRLPRLVVRKTNKSIIVQLVGYAEDGDKVIVSVSSSSLKKLGWSYSLKSIPAAYLTGLLLAKKGIEKGIKKAIVDIGLQRPVNGSRLYSAVKAAVDAGIDMHVDDKIFPAEDRIKGKHIAGYAKALASDKDAYNRQFSGYLKTNTDPAGMPELFEKIKTKINAG